METKLEKLKKAFYAGDYRKALAIAARFPRLGAEKDTIKKAHEAINHPAFYKELGYQPDELFAAGVKALQLKYSL